MDKLGSTAGEEKIIASYFDPVLVSFHSGELSVRNVLVPDLRAIIQINLHPRPKQIQKQIFS